ncbi:MBOAT family O-acyltransferase [Candidatus Soleaferrea massiliensis]|uniref:MBOAT family O-acyltransferase n=1 Tax=Candidatus Soleaferrea massiliensis TaxID=1470354 RepID=UPI00058DC061|nr:MBOAT family protein [Candidatus Soleaferrea massiliensis]
MVFSSLLFLFYFLPVVLLLYFIVPKKWRNLVLFVSSLFFYAWGEPIYVVIMLFSTVVDYTHGWMVDNALKNGHRRKAKAAVVSSVVINLAILGFFKYGDFLIQNVNSVFGLGIPLMNLTLPIGISFYTFQTMSYSIDVYRREAKVQKNILDFGTYVTLFPQLIAGPIVRYQTVADELGSRRESFDEFGSGVKRFVTGLGKKVLLANTIGQVFTLVSAQDTAAMPVLTAWIGILAYTFQIYFDFSGYSDMAIGLGRMFGFHFLENFDYPYMSKSITEFWRRWHISLGTWFREYVYIPLGGNRKGPWRQIINIMIVWLLTGFWHGASWNFALWGVYFGILLMFEKLFLLKFLKKLPGIVGHIYTMFLVILSWAIFAFDSLPQGLSFIGAMFGLHGSSFMDSQSVYLLYTNLILFAILIVASTNYPQRWLRWCSEKFSKRPALPGAMQGVLLCAVFFVCIAFLVDASYNPFLYFRF